MQAIETKYSGYRFRSRTEAQWAVFFDAIGLNWIYEFEGFNLPGGGKYLPDFFFPDHGYYAEVKGVEFTKEEVEKCIGLSKIIGPGNIVFMLDGLPSEKSYKSVENGKECCDVIFQGIGDKFHPFYWGYDFEPAYMHGAVKAIEESRSARFEYGQTPKN